MRVLRAEEVRAAAMRINDCRVGETIVAKIEIGARQALVALAKQWPGLAAVAPHTGVKLPIC